MLAALPENIFQSRYVIRCRIEQGYIMPAIGKRARHAITG